MTRLLPSERRRRRSAAALTRRRTFPVSVGASARAAAISGTAPRRPTGPSVARARILQPRSQLISSASARRDSTPLARVRLTRTTGATSSGGGHVPGATQLPAAHVGWKRSTRLLSVSATYTSPSQPTAIALGCANSPRPTPRTPHEPSSPPLGLKTSTRLFWLSRTYTLPASSAAIPESARKRPGPLPRAPHSPSAAPAAESSVGFVDEHAIVLGVRDVQLARERRHRDRARPRQLRPAELRRTAQFGEERAVTPQAHDPFPAGIRDIHRSARVDRDARRGVEARAGAARARPLPEIAVTFGGEGLDPLAVGIGDEQLPGRLDREAVRPGERPRAATGQADRAQVVAFGVEHLHAVVGRVGHIGVALRVARQRPRKRELAGFGAVAAPRAREGELRRERDDTVVDVVGHEHVAGGVQRHAVGEAELSRPGARRADRRLERPARAELLEAMVVVVADDHLAFIRRQRPRV